MAYRVSAMGADAISDPLFADPAWWRGSRKGMTPWDELARIAGPKLRIDAAAALDAVKVLYPADYCQRAGLTDGGRKFLHPLFLPFTSRSVSETPLLGHDLICCSGCQNDPELVTRLRSPEDYLSGRLELGVRSGMLRLGLESFRPKALPNEQRPDLIVHDDGVFVAIEEKAVSVPIRDQRVALLYDALEYALFHRGMKLVPTRIEIQPIARIEEWVAQRNPSELEAGVAVV